MSKVNSQRSTRQLGWGQAVKGQPTNGVGGKQSKVKGQQSKVKSQRSRTNPPTALQCPITSLFFKKNKSGNSYLI